MFICRGIVSIKIGIRSKNFSSDTFVLWKSGVNEKDSEFCLNWIADEKKEDKYLGSKITFLLGIEGLEPSRFLKSTDFPLTINFIVVGIDM